MTRRGRRIAPSKAGSPDRACGAARGTPNLLRKAKVIHYQDENVTLHAGDCLDVLAELADDSVDAVVTDPPYGLEFMGKDWDAPWKQAGAVLDDPADVGGFQDGNGGNPYSRSRIRYGRGTAGKVEPIRGESTDDSHPFRNGGNCVEYGRGGTASIGFQEWCTLWSTECLRVLKPGGHILAFGGTRMWHRLAAAIEDSGFEIRDSIAWLYGSGFPKSRDVSEAMARYQAGETPEPGAAPVIRPGLYEVTAHLRAARDNAGWTNKQIDDLFGTNGMAGHWTSQASQPACPSVRQWAELKAALGMGDEMDALVEQLAASERPEDWGQGDGSDGPFLDTLHKAGDFKPMGGWGTALKPAFEPVVVGRKPFRGSVSANVLAYGTGAINIDDCRVGTDERLTTRSNGEQVSENGSMSGANYGRVAGPTVAGRWPANVLLDDTQAAELDAQGGRSVSRRGELTSTPGTIYGGGKGLPSWSGVGGYDDEGGASRFFPTFRYTAKASTAERPTLDGQSHPTVKPLELMRWLVRLVTPPGGTVLEPFAGSGTTIQAALAEGKRCIAIERDDTYLRLIVSRIDKTQLGFDFGGN